MKKCLSILMSAIILCSALFVGVPAVSAATATYVDVEITAAEGVWTYKVNPVTHEALLKSFTRNKDVDLTNFTVKSSFVYKNEIYKITEIPTGLLSEDFLDVENLKIESGITTIKYNAFIGCEKLKTVTIPSTLSTCKVKIKDNVGYGAFSGSEVLEKIIYEEPKQNFIPYGLYAGINSSYFDFTVPKSIKNVGDKAFSSSSVSVVDLPDTVTTIPSGCYENCKNLTSVSFPDNITAIGSGCFYFCENIKSIKFNNKITSIPKDAFSGTNITSLSIPNTINKIGASAFAGCVYLKTVNLSNKIDEIPTRTFLNCYEIQEMNIPTSVKKIGVEAFKGCSKLAKIIIPGSVSIIQNNAFDANSDVITIYGGDNSEAERYAKSYNIKFVSISKNIELTKEHCYLKNKNYTYTGKEIKPVVSVYSTVISLDKNGNVIAENVTKLQENADYYIFYENNIKIGSGKIKVVGMGDYTGTVTLNFSIKRKEIEKAKVSFNKSKFTYNGKLQYPVSTVSLDGKTLKYGDDYTFDINNGKNAGLGTVIFKGKGNYTGTLKRNYYIYPNKPTTKIIARNTTSLEVAVKSSTPVVGYKIQIYDKNTNKLRKVHTVPYAQAKSGYLIKDLPSNKLYTIVVSSYCITSNKKTLYSSKIYLTGLTKLKTTVITTAKRDKYKNILIKWKKLSGASGYIVEVCRNKNFTGSTYKKITIKNSRKTEYKIAVKYLNNSKSKYYVRVRGYRTYGNKPFYGVCSKYKVI